MLLRWEEEGPKCTERRVRAEVDLELQVPTHGVSRGLGGGGWGVGGREERRPGPVALTVIVKTKKI